MQLSNDDIDFLVTDTFLQFDQKNNLHVVKFGFGSFSVAADKNVNIAPPQTVVGAGTEQTHGG